MMHSALNKYAAKAACDFNVWCLLLLLRTGFGSLGNLVGVPGFCRFVEVGSLEAGHFLGQAKRGVPGPFPYGREACDW
jgi:hypothetical protein